MADKLLFYYFGDDEAYCRALQGEFKKNTRLSFDFKQIYEKQEKHIQALFLKVFNNQPKVVFIDFSKHTPDYMHLARIISRTPMEHPVVLVGLVDYLSPPEIIQESVATGVQLIYIKSAEIFDVIFDVAKLIAPQEIEGHGFANATLKGEEWTAGITAKVGFVQADGLHIESSYKMGKGERLTLNHAWTKGRVVPSQEIFVKEVSQTNMFYNFKYNADVDFVFINEFLPPEGMEEDRIKEKVTERDELVLHHTKQLKKWIEENLDSSHEKKSKILIVDKQFHFYQDQQRTDKHPYIIRCLPFLKDIQEELNRLQPQVIAFSMDKEDVSGKKNDNEALVLLTQAIKSNYGEDYRPFIIVFNAAVSSREMQDNMAYPNSMASEKELSVEVILQMAELFEKKMKKTGKAPVGKVGHKVFIRKTNHASTAEILIPITIVKLSESDLIFQTDSHIEVGMNLHITQPVDMYVHVQPTKASGKVPEFSGLIHCLGEDDKKELRRYVNSVFFREHDAKLQAQSDEFKKLNDLKLQQKIDLEKVQTEAAAKEAEEAKHAEESEPEKSSEDLDS